MFMLEQDAISGKMAKAFATINGNVEELFYAKTGNGSVEKTKTDVPLLGKTNIGSKSTGWKGTGTLTMHYITSTFRRLMIDYIKTGRDFYFDLQIVNEDPQSRAGKQTVVLKNCNIDSMILVQFDATTDDPLEEELPFTFDDADILNQFNSL